MLSRLWIKLAALAAALDAIATRLGDAAPSLAWTLLQAAALGSGAWVMGHAGEIPLLDHNKVALSDGRRILAWIAAAAAAIGLFHGAAFAAARRRGDARGFADVVAENRRRLTPVLALPLLEALLLPGIERDRPKETLFLAAIVAIVAGAAIYRRPVAPDGERVPRGVAAIAVAALWASYATFFSRLSIQNHHALNTRTLSLGFYDNIFYQSIHGRPLGCSFIKAGYHGSAHFDPILVLLSPLYLLHPRAELLLVLQSVWLGAGVVPVYLLARRALAGRGAALAFAAMYAVYPPLHGANLYEFHSLTLAAPLTLWVLYFLEVGPPWRYWIALAAALLVREDIPILMGFVGAHAVLTRRPPLVRTGWITILVSLVYFAALKRWLMTSPDIFMTGPDAYSFAYNYEDLIPNHDGARGMVISALTNPAFVLRTVLTEPKIVYLATLFVPLAFLPFAAPRGRLILAWGLAFSLLSTRAALHSVYFHYPCVIIPVAFALAPAGLRRIEGSSLIRAAGLDGARLGQALLAAALTASALVSWKYGGILPNATFRAGYLPVARSLGDAERETYAWVREQVDRIPESASLGVTNRTGPHASNRPAVFYYSEQAEVDWLFIDESELSGPSLARHQENLEAGTFTLVSRHDTLAVYRRARIEQDGAP